MNNTPSGKLRSLAWIGFATGVVLFLIWFFVIRLQLQQLQEQRDKHALIDEQIAAAQRIAKMNEAFLEGKEASQQKLKRLETNLPSGDPYRWMIRTMMSLRDPSRVEIIDVDPVRSGEFNRLPKVPYHFATFSIGGKATYHDFGKFLMDLERRYYLMSLERLELSPAFTETMATNSENKIVFKMDVTTLTK